jgi:hypothetical protein
LLQPVVDGAREDHAAQDLAPLVRRERGGNRLTPQEPVDRLQQLLARRRHARPRGHARRGVGKVDCVDLDAARDIGAQFRRIDPDRVDRLLHHRCPERVPFHDECGKPAGDAGRRITRCRLLHSVNGNSHPPIAS